MWVCNLVGMGSDMRSDMSMEDSMGVEVEVIGQEGIEGQGIFLAIMLELLCGEIFGEVMEEGSEGNGFKVKVEFFSE